MIRRLLTNPEHGELAKLLDRADEQIRALRPLQAAMTSPERLRFTQGCGVVDHMRTRTMQLLGPTPQRDMAIADQVVLEFGAMLARLTAAAPLAERGPQVEVDSVVPTSEVAAPDPPATGPTPSEILEAHFADIGDGGRGGERAIGKRLGLSEATVQRWRRRHGLIPWPKNEPGEPGSVNR